MNVTPPAAKNGLEHIIQRQALKLNDNTGAFICSCGWKYTIGVTMHSEIPYTVLWKHCRHSGQDILAIDTAKHVDELP